MIGNGSSEFIDKGSPPLAHSRAFTMPARGVRNMPANPYLLVCADESEQAIAVSDHALAIACSLGLEVTFARVIEEEGGLISPADPIDWRMRRREQRDKLSKFAERGKHQRPAKSVLLTGSPVEELFNWSLEHGATMLALGRRRTPIGRGLGSTAKDLLERGEHSLLIVPPGPARDASYRRIMVPLDGSARGDAVLPIARRIARSHGAALVLVHVVSKLEVAESARDLQLHRLHQQVEHQRKREGQTHLEAIQQSTNEAGIEVQTMVCGPGDPRSVLRDLASSRDIDLIVMAAHGITGLEDVACGSVTEYLAGHSPVPLLIVRPNIRCSFGSTVSDCRESSAFRLER